MKIKRESIYIEYALTSLKMVSACSVMKERTITRVTELLKQNDILEDFEMRPVKENAYEDIVFKYGNMGRAIGCLYGVLHDFQDILQSGNQIKPEMACKCIDDATLRVKNLLDECGMDDISALLCLKDVEKHE